MGCDPVFLFRHNLNVTDKATVACQLEDALNIKVDQTIAEFMIADLPEELRRLVKQFKPSPTEEYALYLKDYFFKAELCDRLGLSEQEVLERFEGNLLKFPDVVVRDLLEYRQGIRSYGVDYDSAYEKRLAEKGGESAIYGITNDFISGALAGFRMYCIWEMFDGTSSLDSEIWQRFHRIRRAFLEHFFPLMKEPIAYYFGDQSPYVEIENFHYSKELEERLPLIPLFDVTGFLRDGIPPPDTYFTVYRDDFSDLLSRS